MGHFNGPAPIALFVYNRPEHARRTIDALAGNTLAQRSDLVIYSDGPKDAADGGKVAQVRKLVASVRGFRTVRSIEAAVNQGLAASIIAGVTAMTKEWGRVVIVEDDLVTSPHFLQFMNDGLDCYEDEERVSSISGYMFPHGATLPETFFLPGTSCWGWATWRRAWSLFEPDGQKLLSEISRRKLARQFDYDGTYPYTDMLREQVAGMNQSWAIRWRASTFLAGKLQLYPSTSLVINVGTDGSGTHGSNIGDRYDSEIAQDPVRVRAVDIATDRSAYRAVRRFNLKSFHGNLVRRSARRIKSRLARIARVGFEGARTLLGDDRSRT